MITIEGQPAIFLLDLEGNEYPAMVEVQRKRSVNGQREITLSFLYDEINESFIHDVEFGWKVLFGGEWYTILSPTYATDGDVFSVGVDAVLTFFVDLNGHFLQDEAEGKSFTPMNYFTDLFQGTGYSFVLVDSLSSNTLSFQPNESKTERFLYGIDRFGGEYVIRGKTAYIYALAGSDKDVILHEDLNIKEVSIEVDGSGFHTWAKGFGDKDENEENAKYKLEVEYVSPLAQKYGMIEGPAIRDGSYKYSGPLTEAVKKQVENSYKVSTTVGAVDLTNNGYPEMRLEEGDRIWLYVSTLKQNTQVRVVEIEEVFDWEGNVVDVQYVLGNEGIATRYKTSQYDTLRDFQDIIAGRKPIEFSWLPEAIQWASDIINGNLDSHFIYNPGEIIGINKNNPNGYMRFNTDGIGFSRDGGKTYKTAMTYEGVVAESILVGHLIGVTLSSLDEKGYFSVSGNEAEFLDTVNGRRVIISPSGLYGYNAGNSVRFQADQALVTSAALGTSNDNVYLASNNEGRVVHFSSIPGDGRVDSYTYLPFRSLMYRFPRIPYGYFTILDGGEFRFTGEDTTNRVYQNVRMGRVFSNNIEVNGGDILYLRAPARVRAMGVGDSESYIDIQAARYLLPTGSSAFSSTFSLLSMPPKEEEAISMVKELDIVRHTSDGTPEFQISGTPSVTNSEGDAIDVNKTIGLLLKANQELIARVEALENELEQLKAE